ncbi:chorismate-binding protein [Psychroserpens sp.]|uniref:chorismate-binding protein n=1 Tax=Psychroserpens sp. TaxID=2020870 RepID=UPI00385D2FEE
MLTKEFFSHIENHYAKELPFVVYNKPNSIEVKTLLQDSTKIYSTEDFSASGFVFSPFEDKLQTILLPIEHSELLSCNIEISVDKEFTYNKIKSNREGKEVHLKLVQQGIDAIQNQLLQKVVLSRCETVPISDAKPIKIFQKLIRNYPSAFVYCWYHPKIGLWLGATPETLINIEGNRFKTMALAGTQTFMNTLDVTWGNKEQEEQQLVTEFIKDNLSSSASNMSISDVKTVRAGNLLHLQSNIKGVLNSALRTVLEKLHPTPAVCGLPVDDAKTFIKKNESYNREYYTGFLGELNLKETKSRNTNRRNVENNAYGSVKKLSHLFVNLRCMQIKNERAFIYVGGGITKDSNPEHEWQETVYKAETMKRVLIS